MTYVIAEPRIGTKDASSVEVRIPPVSAKSIASAARCQSDSSDGSAVDRHVPIHELKRLLGHSSIRTTEGFYLAAGDDLSARVTEAFAWRDADPAAQTDAQLTRKEKTPTKIGVFEWRGADLNRRHPHFQCGQTPPSCNRNSVLGCVGDDCRTVAGVEQECSEASRDAQEDAQNPELVVARLRVLGSHGVRPYGLASPPLIVRSPPLPPGPPEPAL